MNALIIENKEAVKIMPADVDVYLEESHLYSLFYEYFIKKYPPLEIEIKQMEKLVPMLLPKRAQVMGVKETRDFIKEEFELFKKQI